MNHILPFFSSDSVHPKRQKALFLLQDVSWIGHGEYTGQGSRVKISSQLIVSEKRKTDETPNVADEYEDNQWKKGDTVSVLRKGTWYHDGVVVEINNPQFKGRVLIEYNKSTTSTGATRRWFNLKKKKDIKPREGRRRLQERLLGENALA